MKEVLLLLLVMLCLFDATAQPRFERVSHTLPYRIHPAVIALDSAAIIFGGFNGKSMERGAYLFRDEKFQPLDLAYPGKGFSDNIAFATDSFFYVGGGMDSAVARYGMTDFWRYNRFTKVWQLLKDLPFFMKQVAGISNTADGVYIALSELDPVEKAVRYSTAVYRYSPAEDSWTAVSRFPLRYHYGGPAFFSGGNIYVLTTNNVLGDRWSGLFYRYDIAGDKWSELQQFTGSPRILPFSFADEGMLYVGGGTLPFTACNCDDLYGYDLQTRRWTKTGETAFSLVHGLSWKTSGVRYVGAGRDNAKEDVRSLFRVTVKQ